MASTFGSFEIAKSGMMTYNQALQVTFHNVANVETKGYSKQTANITSMVGNKSSMIAQGFGVTVTDISRSRNEYYDTKYQLTNTSYNRYKTEAYYLSALQDQICGNVTSDDKVNLTDAFDTFTDVLSHLVGNPNNSTIRTQATTTAQTFTEYVNGVATKLQSLQAEANTEIKTCVDQINAYAKKITSLTRQINTIEAYGNTANDLRDQRSLMIDELSQFVSVETLEKAPADGVGETQYYVYVGGQMLVDTYNVNELVVKQKDTVSNINDITGCYDVAWADGSSFSPYASSLGGRLQALFEMRDGNNATVVDGTITAYDAGTKKLTVENTNCNDLLTLNIPASDGEITINNRRYAYNSFEVKVDADGKYTYEFNLKDTNDELMQIAVDKSYTAHAGTSVNAKGIPYYMAQLNEFARTYAQEFNRIHKQGLDLNDEAGIDFFNATIPANGKNYVMNESVNGLDQGFTSIVGNPDADGKYQGSYYYMTALNFTVTKEVLEDSNKIACKANGNGSSVGNDNGDNIQKLSKLKDDSQMFVHGEPDAFLQSMTSALGVNASKASTLEKSESNLLYSIDTNRKSVSGVDEDEEGSDMIVFQNMLKNQYKVISVMNEVLDKLINEMV